MDEKRDAAPKSSCVICPFCAAIDGTPWLADVPEGDPPRSCEERYARCRGCGREVRAIWLTSPLDGEASAARWHTAQMLVGRPPGVVRLVDVFQFSDETKGDT